MTTPGSPQALLCSRSYVRLLVLAALLGVVVSGAAYGFLALVSYLQKEIFTHLPHGLGFSAEPAWALRNIGKDLAGLGRIVYAAPEVATALGYDLAAALEEPDGG